MGGGPKKKEKENGIDLDEGKTERKEKKR